MVAFDRYVGDVGIPATVHTLVGVALGLLLVFRTNSSYNRFWEGRQFWGSLVNEIAEPGPRGRRCTSGATPS